MKRLLIFLMILGLPIITQAADYHAGNATTPDQGGLDFGSGNRKVGSVILTGATGGVIDSIRVYTNITNTADSISAAILTYGTRNSHSDPVALLDSTGHYVAVSGNHWYSLPVALHATITGATNYYICYKMIGAHQDYGLYRTNAADTIRYSGDAGTWNIADWDPESINSGNDLIAEVWWHSVVTCTTPINTLTWTGSDTLTSWKQLVVVSTISNTFDSVAYYDSLSGGTKTYVTTLTGASPQTETITGLNINSNYRVWAYAKRWGGTSICIDTDYVDCKTPGSPFAIDSCRIDSCTRTTDSAYFRYWTPNQSADDTVKIRVLATSCGDSSTITLKKPFANNTTDSIEFGTLHAPRDTAYVSGWIFETYHLFGPRICANRIFYQPNCTQPTLTSTYIHADTLIHSFRIVDSVYYGASVIDSIRYQYDTDSTIAGSSYKGAYPDSGTTHTIIISGLNDNDWYRVWAIGWSHATGFTCAQNGCCSETSYVDCKTKHAVDAWSTFRTKTLGIKTQ